MTDAIDRALAGLNPADFGTDDQDASGEVSPETVPAVVRALDPARGHRILLIGVGTGYVARLLELVVGSPGWVVAVEPNQAVARRARARLEACGSTVRVVTADPMQVPAWVLGTRYHRVVGTAAVETVPDRWVTGTAIGGRMVVRVQLAPVAGATATAVLLRAHGRLNGAHFLVSGEHKPVGGADPVLVDARDRDSWVSAAWLRHQPGAAWALARVLNRARTCATNPLQRHERVADLAGWLYAQRPTHLTVASAAGALAVGASTPTGFSGIALNGTSVIEAGGGPEQARRQFRRWVVVWRECGRPGLAQLTPVATPHETGWRIRAAVAPGHQPGGES